MAEGGGAGASGGTFELRGAAVGDVERHEALLEEFERRARARAQAVPTAVADVKARLRAMGHPVTLFGEDPADRRDRLRKLMAESGEDALAEAAAAAAAEGGEGDGDFAEAIEQRELFYTEGGEGLLAVRRRIAAHSLSAASARLAARRTLATDEAAARRTLDERSAALAAARRVELGCSELGDERPLSACAFSSGSGGGGAPALVTASWGGVVRVWSSEGDELQRRAAWIAGAERVTGVALHPRFSADSVGRATDGDGDATMGGGGNDGVGEAGAGGGAEGHVLTASADGTATVWSAAGGRRQTLRGHLERLARCAWHPMGDHVATASYDKTWRLWDVETGAELLLQEGHSRAVYSVAFQCDGALVATGGMDELVRVWDCRSGKCVHVCKGHAKSVLSVDFSPDGYTLASGSEDNTVRLWDLRKRVCHATLPAHVNLVSAVRFSRETCGAVVASASFDGTAALWSTRDGGLLRRLSAHEGKVADLDVDARGRVATVAHDRTAKLWAPPID